MLVTKGAQTVALRLRRNEVLLVRRRLKRVRGREARIPALLAPAERRETGGTAGGNVEARQTLGTSGNARKIGDRSGAFVTSAAATSARKADEVRRAVWVQSISRARLPIVSQPIRSLVIPNPPVRNGLGHKCVPAKPCPVPHRCQAAEKRRPDGPPFTELLIILHAPSVFPWRGVRGWRFAASGLLICATLSVNTPRFSLSAWQNLRQAPERVMLKLWNRGR